MYHPYYPPIGQYSIAPPPHVPGYNNPPPTPMQLAAFYPSPGMPITPTSMTPAFYPPPTITMGQVLSPTALPSGMFTRNLIGSLSASAFKLVDPQNKIGVWFILQDLSVRTEGTFRCAVLFSAIVRTFYAMLGGSNHVHPRLKMNFVNVGDGSALNTKSAPILASVFSDVFQVFSAKKFPGVIESTDISKCFATQGIKIPIRKDGPKAMSNQREYDDEQ